MTADEFIDFFHKLTRWGFVAYDRLHAVGDESDKRMAFELIDEHAAG